MNETLETKAPGTGVAVRPRRSWLRRTWDDPESRPVLVGLAAVILVHLLILLIGYLGSRGQRSMMHPSKSFQTHNHQFNIHIAPQAPQPERTVRPKKFVETNPDAPENKPPDKTDNFAARNQQAAQEKPQADAHGDHAQLVGRKDIQSNQVVSGQLMRNEPPVPPTPVAQPPKPYLVVHYLLC